MDTDNVGPDMVMFVCQSSFPMTNCKMLYLEALLLMYI